MSRKRQDIYKCFIVFFYSFFLYRVWRKLTISHNWMNRGESSNKEIEYYSLQLMSKKTIYKIDEK